MIISASRRTDIPGIYSDWFYDKVSTGHLYIKNPFNKMQVKKIILSPENIDCIVFWTKDPKPFLSRLKLLKDYKYYFHFTLNNYPSSIEENLAPLDSRIESFKRLSDIVGPDRIIWRYDPVFYTEDINQIKHLESFSNLCNRLSGFTTVCITSILTDYKKTQSNMKQVKYRIPDHEETFILINGFMEISDKSSINLKGCCLESERVNTLIPRGSCVDPALIEKISDRKTEYSRDKNQRNNCNCISSIDIGVYDTCINRCLYCYGTRNHTRALKSHSCHRPEYDFPDGNLSGHEKITYPHEKKYLSCGQLKLF